MSFADDLGKLLKKEDPGEMPKEAEFRQNVSIVLRDYIEGKKRLEDSTVVVAEPSGATRPKSKPSVLRRRG